MKSIDVLIEHIANSVFPLNEYSEGEMKKLMQHFKDEADDFEIEIDDDRLETYIKRFDQIKSSLGEKDIYKYSLPTLLKLLSRDSKTKEKVEREEDTPIENIPDEVYRSPDEKILLLYGMNLKDGDPGCVRLKQSNEPWCITKSGNSNWRSYRKQSDLGHPSFYLAYNFNLPKTDKYSGVALQARANNRYAYTDRTNSPGMSESMSFERLVHEVPWLQEIPDLKSKLKWVPLSKQEKLELKGSNLIDLVDWKNLPYQKKLDYFEARREDFERLSLGSNYSNIFKSVNIDSFLEKVLPKYPDVLKHLIDISINPATRVFSPTTLLAGYEAYPEAQKKSLLRHIGTEGNKVPLEFLTSEQLPFELKKDITKNKVWNSSTRSGNTYYVFDVPNKDIIVRVETGRNFRPRFTFITPEQTFYDKPLTDKTVKYIIQDPNIVELPFTDMAMAITDGHIQGKDIKSLIGKYLNAPDTTIKSKNVDGKTIIFDEGSLAAFELDGDTLTKLDNPQDFLDKIASTDEEKASLQDNFFKNITSKPEWMQGDLPSTVDKNSFIALINGMPYEKRTIDGNIMFGIANPTGYEPIVFLINPNSPEMECYPQASWGRGTRRDWYDHNGRMGNARHSFDQGGWQELLNYWRNTGKTISDEQLKSIMGSGEGYEEATKSKYILARNYVPMAANAELKPVMVGDLLVLVNRTNPEDSYTVSRSRGRLSQKPLTASKVRTILGEPAPERPATPQAQLRQRVAQAAQAREPAQGEEPAVPQQAGAPQEVRITPGPHTGEQMQTIFLQLHLPFGQLPGGVRNRILQGAVIAPARGDRGAEARNQLLGGRGVVTAVARLEGRSSAIYFIRMASGTVIATIAMQPGNYQLLATPGAVRQLGSMTNLTQVLQANNITEEEKGVCIREFLAENPSMVGEVKNHLTNYLKERNMKKPSAAQMLKEVLKRLVKENQPATAPTKPATEPAVAPGKPGTDKPKPRRPLGNPDVKPKPKAVMSEEEVVDKIVKRFKSKK